MNATDLPAVELGCPLGCPNRECEHDVGQHDGRHQGSDDVREPVCSVPGCPCGAGRAR